MRCCGLSCTGSWCVPGWSGQLGHLFCSVVCQTAWECVLKDSIAPGWAQAFKLKSFHDLLSIKQGCCLGYLYQFYKFRENSPASLSLIPVVGWSDKPIPMSHLTYASKKHHKRQIPLLLPCQDKLAKKAPLE